MKRKQRELLAKFEEVTKELSDTGLTVVAVVSEYDKKSAHFHTYLNVNEDPSLGLTEDHLVLDAVREVVKSWSKKIHTHGY